MESPYQNKSPEPIRTKPRDYLKEMRTRRVEKRNMSMQDLRKETMFRANKEWRKEINDSSIGKAERIERVLHRAS